MKLVVNDHLTIVKDANGFRMHTTEGGTTHVTCIQIEDILDIVNFLANPEISPDKTVEPPPNKSVSEGYENNG